MMYVTFAPDGTLTGAYMQDVLPAHQAAHIPVVDPAVYANWVKYQANLARDGLELAPPPPPPGPVVPTEVTMRQGREALIRAGLDGQVDAALAAIVDPLQKKIALNYWQNSNAFERSNPLIATLGAALGLTSAQIDALFIQAATL